jgi:hypothetical protein
MEGWTKGGFTGRQADRETNRQLRLEVLKESFIKFDFLTVSFYNIMKTR